MAKRSTHRRIQGRIAGRTGRREVPIKGRRRLDVKKGHRATEIERSGSRAGIQKSLSRLKTQKGVKRELLVPQKDLSKAKEIAQKKDMTVLIQNLSRSRRRIVKRSR
ncbi:hypothetical protein E3J62_04775 [candidate division TA06 bacterium]|uniref:Uncharacterized protein n=1 Tax=candidate division TA06 bacterium TaxID=2250710 RepID=A0A523UVA2_UNCT6|nr:MAG: hypothetical protein E3J62_04775 [candidate division TA06 bacterium]